MVFSPTGWSVSFTVEMMTTTLLWIDYQEVFCDKVLNESDLFIKCWLTGSYCPNVISKCISTSICIIQTRTRFDLHFLQERINKWGGTKWETIQSLEEHLFPLTARLIDGHLSWFYILVMSTKTSVASRFSHSFLLQGFSWRVKGSYCTVLL